MTKLTTNTKPSHEGRHAARGLVLVTGEAASLVGRRDGQGRQGLLIPMKVVLSRIPRA